MKVNFTNYNSTDFCLLKEMVFALYKDEIDNFDEEAITENKIIATINRTQTNPKQVKIKIFKSQEITLGYAIITYFWSNEYGGMIAILDEIFVLPQYRGNGIASQFISNLSKKNYKGIVLEVFKKNTKALKLYQNLNFKIIDRYFMKKML